MAIETVQKYNPSTRFTRKGNSYQKTNICKLAGFGLGTGYTVAGMIINKDTINDAFEISRQMMKEQMPEYAEETEQLLKSTKNLSIATAVISMGLLGLGVGALFDFVVNRVKAFKADHAEKAE